MKIILIALLLSTSLLGQGQQLSQEEQSLYNLIMQYRKTKNLPPIPLSPSLTIVAQTHAHDLADNNPDQGRCNLHSWSNKGSWSACCYTDDHAKAQCMWYKGNGYEISAWSSDDISASKALDLWKSSPGHHAVIINSGIWNSSWQAIGIGIYGGYALVWFGNEPDSQSKK
jgi:uncharacterized protein YkwD